VDTALLAYIYLMEVPYTQSLRLTESDHKLLRNKGPMEHDQYPHT